MTEFKFSVIVPVYNRESTICAVIESVLNQGYDEWELILIDDGSTDKTGEICREYTDDIRIRYFCKSNGGVCTARNFGLDNATGDYIVFLDSDNLLKNDMLNILNSKINCHSGPELICFGFGSEKNSWAPDSEKLITRSEIRNSYIPAHINIYPQKENFLKNYIWNKCYKQDFLSKNKIRFDESRRTWEDGRFVIDCFDRANEILLIKEVLYSTDCGYQCEHLSSRVFENQLRNYIDDEIYYKTHFYNEYDFRSLHYCRSNFNVLNILFGLVVNTFGEKAELLISEALDKPIVPFWCNYVTPENLFEKKTVEYIKTKNAKKLCKLFGQSVLNRVLRKIYRRV